MRLIVESIRHPSEEEMLLGGVEKNQNDPI